jgi:hypothetical protein
MVTMINDKAFINKSVPKIIRRIFLGLILLTYFLPQNQVKADIAPFELPDGASIYPSVPTKVRMVSEIISLDVPPPSPDLPVEAKVIVKFSMRNVSQASEKLVVGFPISCIWCVGSDGMPAKIDDFAVEINSTRIATRDVISPTLAPPLYQINEWSLFDVTFPPEQDVNIQVTYTAGGWGDYPFTNFDYILKTGAAWYDTIGSVDIIARLPYSVNEQNTIFGDYDTTPGSIISVNELRWHFDNLEPDFDFKLNIIQPWLWYTAQVEENNVIDNPKDGEAWGRLGQKYKQMIFLRKGVREDSGGISLYKKSIEAYKNATSLLPKDALWHAGFAELIYQHYRWTEQIPYESVPNHAIDLTELVRAVEQIRFALTIDPNNELALYLAQDINYWLPNIIVMPGDRYEYPILTSTAHVLEVLQPENATPIPTRPSTAAPTHTPNRNTSTSPVIVAITQPVSTRPTINSQIGLTPTSTSSTSYSISTTNLLLIAIPVAVVLILGMRWLFRKNRP